MTAQLTLADIEELARYALDEHGLTADGWTFRWDRAVRRLGQCRYSTRQISLSRPVFEVTENRDLALNTILHEVAHALSPTAGHGPTWKRTAVLVGARPERCAQLAAPVDLPVKGLCGCPDPHQMARMPRRTYSCNRCSQTVTWVRRP